MWSYHGRTGGQAAAEGARPAIAGYSRSAAGELFAQMGWARAGIAGVLRQFGGMRLRAAGVRLGDVDLDDGKLWVVSKGTWLRSAW
jgi:hypothetical protein